ncbi:Leo1-like protein-domain-containing protein [Pavlovales sp. CCMP2436]|nr:Leo1-like protein-domain-containing protein [Pavlovales sp. CCMP2436]
MGESGGATYQDLFGSDEEDDEVQARPAAPEAEAEAGEEAAAGPDEGAEEEGAADQDGEGGGEAEAEAKADAVGEGGADDDLFGEREEEAADVIEEEDERAAARTSRQDLLVDDIPRAPPLHLSIPQLPRPKPGRLCYARLPNILGVEARPFDANSYDPDEEAKRGTVRENVVRWRYGQNSAGEAARESNTRLVRWSDGSLTLHVGAEGMMTL